MARGAVFIIGVVLVGLCAGAFAVWWNVHATQCCRAFWGEPAFTLARTGPHVEYLKLSPDTPTDGSDSATPRERIVIGEQTFVVAERVKQDDAKGLVHLRHALTADDQYAWDASPATERFQPTIGFRFASTDGATTATLLFDIRASPSGPSRRRTCGVGQTGQKLAAVCGTDRKVGNRYDPPPVRPVLRA
ncbi:MAG: hypothetical protein QM811_23320 [Pirellulales bacterium]